MSRGFVHQFTVTSSSGDVLTDSEGRWTNDTAEQTVRGRLGLTHDLLRAVANPESFDLVALVPTDTKLTVPVTVTVPAGYERDAAPGTYVVQEIRPSHLHVRLLCTRLQPEEF